MSARVGLLSGVLWDVRLLGAEPPPPAASRAAAAAAAAEAAAAAPGPAAAAAALPPPGPQSGRPGLGSRGGHHVLAGGAGRPAPGGDVSAARGGRGRCRQPGGPSPQPPAPAPAPAPAERSGGRAAPGLPRAPRPSRAERASELAPRRAAGRVPWAGARVLRVPRAPPVCTKGPREPLAAAPRWWPSGRAPNSPEGLFSRSILILGGASETAPFGARW